MIWLIKCCKIQRNNFMRSTKELFWFDKFFYIQQNNCFDSTNYFYIQRNNYFNSTNYLHIQQNNYYHSTNYLYIQRNNYFDSTNYLYIQWNNYLYQVYTWKSSNLRLGTPPSKSRDLLITWSHGKFEKLISAFAQYLWPPNFAEWQLTLGASHPLIHVIFWCCSHVKNEHLISTIPRASKLCRVLT